MKRYLALLVMAVFVAMQFADIAILDAAPIDALDLHTQSDQGKQDVDGCLVCCSCHSLHHMATSAAPSAAVHVSLTGPKLPRDYAAHEAYPQGPPVPPPNA